VTARKEGAIARKPAAKQTPQEAVGQESGLCTWIRCEIFCASRTLSAGYKRTNVGRFQHAGVLCWASRPALLLLTSSQKNVGARVAAELLRAK
jgi:hypothetical protein